MPRSTNPETLARRERVRKALRLRSTGLGYGQIASECAYPTADAARKAVGRLLARQDAEDVRAARAIHRERLDWLLRTFWLAATNPGMAQQAARQGNQPPPPDQIAAAQTILRLMVEQARVEGLYAPTKAEVSGTVSQGRHRHAERSFPSRDAFTVTARSLTLSTAFSSSSTNARPALRRSEFLCLPAQRAPPTSLSAPKARVRAYRREPTDVRPIAHTQEPRSPLATAKATARSRSRSPRHDCRSERRTPTLWRNGDASSS
jgi:hypothetical protein